MNALSLSLALRQHYIDLAKRCHKDVMKYLRVESMRHAVISNLAIRSLAMFTARNFDLIAKVITDEASMADADRKGIMEELEIERHFCDTYRNLAQEAVHHPYRYAWKHFIKGLPK